MKQREAKEREEKEGKNDPADRLYLGLRIDVHLSPASVISPTNHDMTSTGQYLTLQASSSHMLTSPPSARTHSTTGPRLLLELINLAANHTACTPESNSIPDLILGIQFSQGSVWAEFTASGHFRLVCIIIQNKADYAAYIFAIV